MKQLILSFIFLCFVSFNINSQNGLNFTGNADHTFVLGQDNASLDITQGTIEAWIKTADPGSTGDSGYRGIIVKHYSYSLYIYNNELVTWDNGIPGRVSSDVGVSDDQWHHVALVFNDGVANGSKFYVDGLPVKTFTYNCAPSNEAIVVGQGTDRTGTDGIQHFNGLIDNVRIWNTTRTDAEIFASYNKCLSGNENGLVMLWQFEEGTGTSVTDISGTGNNGTLQNMTNTNWVAGHNCISNNLVAYYPFNNNANDESGNGNHGVLHNSPISTADRFGKANSAYQFNGTNQYISIPNNSNLNIAEGESYSISFWVKHNAQNNAKYIISKYYTLSEPSYAVGTGSNGDSYSWHGFTNNFSGGTESRGNIDLNNNEWHHITSVFKSGESVAIYVDGVLDIEHTVSHTGSISNTRDLTIGCNANLAQYYNGAIDDIKIYKKALSVAEIKEEAQNLLAYYPFNGNSNDESDNGYHGIIYGATPTPDKDGNPNSAYLFDGVDDYIDLGDWENGGAMTFTFWARWDAFNWYSRILDLGNGPSNDNIIIANYQNTASILFSVYKPNSEDRLQTSGIIQGQWDFFATSVDNSGVMTIYKNGLQIHQANVWSPNYVLRTKQYIGKSNFSADDYFEGAIDEVRIFGKTLSPTEIMDIYNNSTLSTNEALVKNNKDYYVSKNNIEFINNTISEIRIYNLLGQQLKAFKSPEKSISLNHLSKGIYIINATHKNGIRSTLKFIIQ